MQLTLEFDTMINDKNNTEFKQHVSCITLFLLSLKFNLYLPVPKSMAFPCNWLGAWKRIQINIYEKITFLSINFKYFSRPTGKIQDFSRTQTIFKYFSRIGLFLSTFKVCADPGFEPLTLWAKIVKMF